MGRPVIKLLLRFKGPFRVIKVDSYFLELALLNNIRVIYIINVLRVKFYVEGLSGQADLNTDIKANKGIIIIRIDNFVEQRRWEYEELFDYEK